MSEALVVEQAGHATVQDLGRSGWARVGVPANGAADSYSARVANILVGNHDGAPLLEVTGSTLAFRTRARLLLAATGAVDQITVGNAARPAWEPTVVDADQRVVVELPRHGWRSYVAVNGGIDAAATLGSVSPDPLLGVGGRLAPADVLRSVSRFESLDHPYSRLPLFRLGAARPSLSGSLAVDVTVGPDADQFDGRPDTLLDGRFTVSPQSDHIGLRLLGITPTRTVSTEILSRGTPVGAIEIPPTGGLILLLRGRPVTAGYPVVAVAAATSIDLLGQSRPGDRLAFRVRPAADCIAALRERHRRLEELAQRVDTLYRHVGIGHVVDDRHLFRERKPGCRDQRQPWSGSAASGPPRSTRPRAGSEPSTAESSP